MVERFILTSYYILNGKTFGKLNKAMPMNQIEETFKKQWSDKKNEIMKNSKVL